MDVKSLMRNLKNDAKRDGYGRALQHLLYYATNKVFYIKRFEIIYLTREHLVPLNPEKYTKHKSRLATDEDMKRMRDEGKWDITEELYDGFKNGDSCLLSFIDDKLAGYTWVHTKGCPRIIPGLRISIPQDYVYNFAGFTLHEFRGFGLQPYRHHQILERPEWSGKTGMIGYVDSTNWSSKKGQSKSGYQRLGSLTMIGTASRFKTIFSSELKKFGIKRLKD